MLSIRRSLGQQFGSLNWMSRGRLFSTIVSAQQQLVDYMLGHDLGERYLGPHIVTARMLLGECLFLALRVTSVSDLECPLSGADSTGRRNTWSSWQ